MLDSRISKFLESLGMADSIVNPTDERWPSEYRTIFNRKGNICYVIFTVPCAGTKKEDISVSVEKKSNIMFSIKVSGHATPFSKTLTDIVGNILDSGGDLCMKLQGDTHLNDVDWSVALPLSWFDITKVSCYYNNGSISILVPTMAAENSDNELKLDIQ